MILTFTDFGAGAPYLAQLKAAALEASGNANVMDMVTNAPSFRPRPAGYLLAHYVVDFPTDAVVIGVVDPGVGTDRRSVVVHAGGRWFVGPDNGLFAPALRLAGGGTAWRIDWRSARVSASFHGRDIFAPVAGRLARGIPPPGSPIDPDSLVGITDPDDLDAVIYVDDYGNAITGRRADTVAAEAVIHVAGRTIHPARTFGDVPVGTAMWYRNANGLVEIAVNQARADTALGMDVDTPIAIAVP
jgi:S-adenosylmethionine hydrolase